VGAWRTLRAVKKNKRWVKLSAYSLPIPSATYPPLTHERTHVSVASVTQLTFVWWNLYNLHDDKDDPKTNDLIKSSHNYHRDLREVAEIIDRIEPRPDIIGCGEVENRGVLDDLAHKIKLRPLARAYHCPGHIESRDPRGIDVGVLVHDETPLSAISVQELWPDDPASVRPMVRVDLQLTGTTTRRLSVIFLHAKSRRSGDTHEHDPMPGSRLRYAYGAALRAVAQECGEKNIPLLVLGDLNDEPHDLSLRVAAGAHVGRVSAQDTEPQRLYNLSREGLSDARGTCMHDGRWLIFDQALVNGVCLRENGFTRIEPVRFIADDPLLYHGEPNRWYSDHLPVLLTIQWD
jgi:endonuclease/exonuclease/phosphatase family metal-dependent hydrolase